MIYSRDKRRGFYWFAPAKNPSASEMPPPVAFDRDVLGDKEAHKAAKSFAKAFYRATDWGGPRIKIYGSDFLAPGYVTSGDGIYFHPAWGTPPGWSEVDVLVAELVSMMTAIAEDASEGKHVAFNLAEIRRDVIRPKVVLASYGRDEPVDERFAAAAKVIESLRDQLEGATSEAEARALRGPYEQAQAQYNPELERLIEERGLSATIDEVASRLSDHMTDDPEAAL